MIKQPALPDGWRWVRLGELCDRIDYGFTASADYSVGEPRFLRITDIQKGFVNWETVPGCKITTDEEAANRLADGDIVFARTGATTGKSFLIQRPPRAVFASYLIRLRLKSDVIPSFIYGFFRSEEYWKQIRANARGGAQPNVNATLLSDIVLPLPPGEEQRRIAAILNEQMGAVERARAATQAQLEAAKALPAAYLRAVFNSAESRNWPMMRLGDILAETRNGLYKPEEYYGRGTRILKMYNIGRLDGTWNLERVDLIQLSEEESIYSLSIGDLLLNRVNSRELVGKCAVVDDSVAGCVFESKNMRLRLNANKADPHFTATWLNSAGGRSQMEDRLKQIVGQATVNRSDLDSIKIPLPALAVQQRIASMLNEQKASAQRVRKAIEEELDAINKLPAALLRRAFNGEL